MTDQIPLVLLTGATGYVGGLLLSQLERQATNVRCLARDPAKIRPGRATTQVVRGDVLDASSLAAAMQGVDTAYYLVHLMSGSKDFEREDRQAAANFADAAKQAGVRRIIYLGGLGDDADPQLSPHLRSRHEVGEILKRTGVETIEFRAGMIVGAGSLSYQLLKSLTDRLPVMLCPKWLRTPTQPIAVDDVLSYLLAAGRLPAGKSRIFEIGGTDVVSYGELIRLYSRLKGLRRLLIFVPVLTPYLSGLWLALVTPAGFEVGRHLIEGLKNPTVVRDRSALEVFDVRPMSVQEAIQRAVDHDGESPTLSSSPFGLGGEWFLLRVGRVGGLWLRRAVLGLSSSYWCSAGSPRAGRFPALNPLSSALALGPLGPATRLAGQGGGGRSDQRPSWVRCRA